MIGLLVVAQLLTQAPAPGANRWINPIVSKTKERDELIAKLRRDIFKVDRAIGETEKLISRSRNAPYLPDLQFRLAELYVEKSRYTYYLQAETRGEGAKGALVSPETKLYKQKAVQLYNRLLREYPDFKDSDQVTFYLAHEQRELGSFEEMLGTLGELVRKYPQSGLRLEAEQILGDYFFDKAELVEAEAHYQAILRAPPSPVHDLARYKMGWIRINQAKHSDAVEYFEAAAASAPLPGQDAQKALNVKREALLDLVYSYTESRPAKTALSYFEKLSESRATFALALDKLGTRYFIKQQYEWAIPALRRLMDVQPDPELDVERAQKLYDALDASKGKVLPSAEDIRFLARAAVGIKIDPVKDEKEQKKTLTELEEMARDLSTKLHQAAQKENRKGTYLEAAAAYAEYLNLFRPEKYVRTMMRNRADALYAAKDFPGAARQFEEVALLEDGNDLKQNESALYASLLAHHASLKAGEVENLNAFEVADARQALKLLGARYIEKYPRAENALEVKFNIARAFYDDGEFEKSGELFADFALANPSFKDASVAGHLALDSYRQRNDFKGIDAVGKKFQASRLPPQFITQVNRILQESRAEAIDELALQSAQETGDVVSGLMKVADENKGTEIAEKALYGAFTAARDRRDYAAEKEVGLRIAADYPKGQFTSDVLLTLGRHAAETAHFEEAASWFEQVGQKMGADFSALEGWLASARLRMALRDHPGAMRSLENAAGVAGARKAEVFTLMAQTHLRAGQYEKARSSALQALKLDRNEAAAAAVLAEAAANLPGTKPDAIIPQLTAVAQGPNAQTDDTAKGLWFLGELIFREYTGLPNEQVEEKVGLLQNLEGVFTQAASVGAPEWAVASLWKLGLAYQHIADVVEATPLPDGLSASEVDQFRAAVKDQVTPLKQRAENVFKVCLSRAESLEVFSAAVIGCRERKDSAKVPSVPPPPPAPGLVINDLQKKVDANLTAEAMEALGLAYLGSGRFPMAELTLGRATELEDTRASSHNALGLAMLLQGDVMGARAAYGRALDADPTYEKARANLAALKCRFGDQEGSRRELALLTTSNLGGPDVDPGWRGCK